MAKFIHILNMVVYIDLNQCNRQNIMDIFYFLSDCINNKNMLEDTNVNN